MYLGMLDSVLYFGDTVRNTKGCHRRNSNDTSNLIFLGYWKVVSYYDIIKRLWCEGVGGEEPIQNFGGENSWKTSTWKTKNSSSFCRAPGS